MNHNSVGVSAVESNNVNYLSQLHTFGHWHIYKCEKGPTTGCTFKLYNYFPKCSNISRKKLFTFNISIKTFSLPKGPRCKLPPPINALLLMGTQNVKYSRQVLEYSPNTRVANYSDSTAQF